MTYYQKNLNSFYKLISFLNLIVLKSTLKNIHIIQEAFLKSTIDFEIISHEIKDNL